RIPRPPRRARCTWVRRRWPRLTKRASRSARKASGLTQEGGGERSPPFFFGGRIANRGLSLATVQRAESPQIARVLRALRSRRRSPFHGVTVSPIATCSRRPKEGMISAPHTSQHKPVSPEKLGVARVGIPIGRSPDEPQGLYAHRAFDRRGDHRHLGRHRDSQVGRPEGKGLSGFD